MKKISTILLTIVVAAAAIFACCMQTQAFVSLVAKHNAHDCCKKNIQQPSDHQNCQCHHDISIAASQLQLAAVVQNLIPFSNDFDFASVDFSPSRFLQTASLYDDGPPVDHPVSKIPLYYRDSILRL